MGCAPFKKMNKDDEKNLLNIDGPGTQIMAKIDLPTALVSFHDRCDQLHCLKDANPSATGFVVLVHLEGSIFGLLSIKKECFGRGRAELLAFNKDDQRVQEEIYRRKKIRINETMHIIRYFPQSGKLSEEDLRKQIKYDMKSAFQSYEDPPVVEPIEDPFATVYNETDNDFVIPGSDEGLKQADAESLDYTLEYSVGGEIRFKVKHKRTPIVTPETNDANPDLVPMNMDPKAAQNLHNFAWDPQRPAQKWLVENGFACFYDDAFFDLISNANLRRQYSYGSDPFAFTPSPEPTNPYVDTTSAHLSFSC